MSSSTVSTTRRFEVIRFAGDQKVTSLEDVTRFAEMHKGERDLIVEINPAGPGDAFADYLETAGLIVRRIS